MASTMELALSFSLPASTVCDFVPSLSVDIRLFYDTVDHRLTEGQHSPFSVQRCIKLFLTSGSEEQLGIGPGLPKSVTRKGANSESAFWGQALRA